MSFGLLVGDRSSDHPPPTAPLLSSRTGCVVNLPTTLGKLKRSASPSPSVGPRRMGGQSLVKSSGVRTTARVAPSPGRARAPERNVARVRLAHSTVNPIRRGGWWPRNANMEGNNFPRENCRLKVRGVDTVLCFDVGAWSLAEATADRSQAGTPPLPPRNEPLHGPRLQLLSRLEILLLRSCCLRRSLLGLCACRVPGLGCLCFESRQHHVQLFVALNVVGGRGHRRCHNVSFYWVPAKRGKEGLEGRDTGGAR